MPSAPSFTLCDLQINDLPPHRRGLAETEIRGMLAPFDQLPDKLDLVQDVELDVVLTDDFRREVERIHAGYNDALSSPYNPVRRAVAAQGIVIVNPIGPPLRLSIVLNQEPWTKDTGYDVVLRAYLFLHECGHVLQQSRGTGAEWGQWRSPAKTHGEALRRAARVLWDEFDADLTADRMCRGFCLKDDQGKPVGPGEHLSSSFTGSVATLLDGLCDFVLNEVQAYRQYQRSLDGLYDEATSLIGELLLVLAHLSALCVGMDKIEELKGVLATLRGFNEYIGDDFQPFLAALDEESGRAAESELVRICNAVYGRVGLEVEDLPQGLYLHVMEPIFCCDRQEEQVTNRPA